MMLPASEETVAAAASMITVLCESQDAQPTTLTISWGAYEAISRVSNERRWAVHSWCSDHWDGKLALAPKIGDAREADQHG